MKRGQFGERRELVPSVGGQESKTLMEPGLLLPLCPARPRYPISSMGIAFSHKFHTIRKSIIDQLNYLTYCH